MPDLKDIFQVLQILLLFGFLGLTSLLFVVTMLNRSSVRSVLLTLHNGRLLGLPIVPVIFVLVVLSLSISAGVRGDIGTALVYGVYALGGVLWAASHFMARATYVTRYGVLHGLSGSGNRVAWSQVHDCFDVERSRGRIYVLFYVDALGVRRRCELRVPKKKLHAFNRIMDRHIYWNEGYKSTVRVDLKTLNDD